jgi:serine/threonine protein kinase
MVSPPPEAQLYLGQTLAGRYSVDEYLAAGGFGFVFKAHDASRAADVALKVLKPGCSADAVLEFEGERDVLNLLRNASNVVTLLDHGTATVPVTVMGTGARVDLDVQYLVLELAAGCLAELLAYRNRLDWSERLALFRGVVRGMNQVHLAEVFHRDLKSENVLLMMSKRQATSNIADFGRSRHMPTPARFSVDEYLTGRGDFRFAPPEFLWRQGNDNEACWRRVDLYHLGSLLYELATGQGITMLALGSPMPILVRNLPKDVVVLKSEFAAAIPALRAAFDSAIDLFAQEVPPSMRFEAVRLVRQLCSPDPRGREPANRLDRKGSGLEWVIRRTDILSLQLSTQSRAGTK